MKHLAFLTFLFLFAFSLDNGKFPFFERVARKSLTVARIMFEEICK